jgi:hypothetical protein
MNSQVGGKATGATSSSDFLRVYRSGILAGANASYQNIPKKAAKSYASTRDLLESQNQRGVLTDLSSLMITESTCPPVPIPPPTPLMYVSTTNIIQNAFPNYGGIAYINNNSLFMVDPYVGRFVITYPLNIPNAAITSYEVQSLTNPIRIIQSVLDGYVYILNADRVIARTGVGDSFLAGQATIATVALPSPTGLTLDYDTGDLYVINYFGAIIRLNPATGIEVPFISVDDSLVAVTYAHGSLYVTGGNTDTIYKVAISTGAVSIFVTGIFATTIIHANDENFYVTTRGPPGGMYRITPGGRVSLFVTDNALDDLYPDAITQGADESFYVHDQISGSIYQIIVA